MNDKTNFEDRSTPVRSTERPPRERSLILLPKNSSRLPIFHRPDDDKLSCTEWT